MSDISQGPGWWQASDGKWYAPELYPKDWKPEPQPTAADTATSGASSEAEAAHARSAAAAQAEADAQAQAAAAQAEADAQAQAAATEAAAQATAPVHPTWEADPAHDKVEAPSGWTTPGNQPAAAAETAVVPTTTPDPTQVQPAVEAPPAAPRYAAPASAAPTGAPPAAFTPPDAGPYSLEEEVFVDNPDDVIAGDPGAGIFALIAGGLLVLASFMDWAIAGGTLTAGAVNGLTGSNGWGTLVCGLAVASCGGLLLMGQRKPWVSALMAVAALVALGLGIFSYLDIGSTSDDLTALLLEAEPPVDLAVAEGAELDYDTGMWLVLAGGVLSLIASGVAFTRRQK